MQNLIIKKQLSSCKADALIKCILSCYSAPGLVTEQAFILGDRGFSVFYILSSDLISKVA